MVTQIRTHTTDSQLVAPSPGLTASTATFLQADTWRNGTWIGTRGTKGVSVLGLGSAADVVPSGCTVTLAGGSYYTFFPASTTYTDPRYVQVIGQPTKTGAIGYYSVSTETITFNFTDGLTHAVAVYFVDPDSRGRNQTIAAYDVSGAPVLIDPARSTGPTSAGLPGVYMVYNVSGSVQFTITLTAGPNTSFSAWFIDPATTIVSKTHATDSVLFGSWTKSHTTDAFLAKPSSATFMQMNTWRNGSWIGAYGSQGYGILNAGGVGNVLPPKCTVTLAGGQIWTWFAAGSYSDPRYVQVPGQPGITAALGYYVNGTETITFNLDDSLPHSIAIYSVDYDRQGRNQTIAVVDGVTGLPLDPARNLGDFATTGVYMVYNVISRVQFQIVNTKAPNCVFSCWFIDPLLSIGTRTHSTDTLTVKTLTVTKTHGTDASLRATQTRTHSTDTRLLITQTRTHNTSTSLRATEIKAHGTDASLRATWIKAHGTDASLRATQNRTHSTDINLRATQTRTHNTSTSLRAAQVKAHGTDASLRTTQIEAHGTDASLLATLRRTHDTDSWLLKTQAVAYSTDTSLQATQIKIHGADSLLLQTRTVTHRVDSWLRTTVTKTHDTDALLQTGQHLVHGTDSTLAVTFVVMHSADSYVSIFTTPTLTHTTDSLTAILIAKDQRAVALIPLFRPWFMANKANKTVSSAQSVNGFRFTMIAISTTNMPTDIFRYRVVPTMTRTSIDQPPTSVALTSSFNGVCSPADLEDFPVGWPGPNARPPWFRLNTIDIVMRSRMLVEDTYRAILDDIEHLVETLNIMEQQDATEIVIISPEP
jgi:hypothetical protein